MDLERSRSSKATAVVSRRQGLWRRGRARPFVVLLGVAHPIASPFHRIGPWARPGASAALRNPPESRLGPGVVPGRAPREHSGATKIDLDRVGALSPHDADPHGDRSACRRVNSARKERSAPPHFFRLRGAAFASGLGPIPSESHCEHPPARNPMEQFCQECLPAEGSRPCPQLTVDDPYTRAPRFDTRRAAPASEPEARRIEAASTCPGECVGRESDQRDRPGSSPPPQSADRLCRPQASDMYEIIRPKRCGPLSLRSKGAKWRNGGAGIIRAGDGDFTPRIPGASVVGSATRHPGRTRADRREASSPTLSNLRRKMIRSISNRSDHAATPSTRTSLEVCALPTIHQLPVRDRRADAGSGQRGEALRRWDDRR